MKRPPNLKLLVPALLSMSIGTYGLAKGQTSAFDSLKTTSVFAFGGVGFAGTMSSGEKAYRIVEKDRQSARLFAALIRDPKSTPAARLYALVGLRAAHSEQFRKESARLAGRREKVKYEKGCVISDVPFETLREDIVKGLYSPRS